MAGSINAVRGWFALSISFFTNCRMEWTGEVHRLPSCLLWVVETRVALLTAICV